MITIAEWCQSIIGAPSVSLQSVIAVIGERRAHLGGHMELATVTIEVVPSEQFATELHADVLQVNPAFSRAALMGVMDELFLTNPYAPLTNVLIRLCACNVDPIESSSRAFRLAGRDAGKKIMEHLTRGRYR